MVLVAYDMALLLCLELLMKLTQTRRSDMAARLWRHSTANRLWARPHVVVKHLAWRRHRRVV